MIKRHAFLYLGSRLAAACLNLGSLAIFARLAGPAGYGAYLIAFAWAYIVHGLGAQGLRMAYFAAAIEHDGKGLVATYARILAGLIVALAIAAAAAISARLLPAGTTLAVVALAAALAIYDSVHEIGRTRLMAERVAAMVLLRAVLVLMLGIAALRLAGSPTALALSVAAAHGLATLPLWPILARDLAAPFSRTAASALVRFGWPLAPAYGIGALGSNADRLLLARFAGDAAVGPYGAVTDLIRQLLMVVPESIASSYFAIAKAAHGRGDAAGAQATLRAALRAHIAVLAFGAAALAIFAVPLVKLLMGPDYAGAVPRVLPGIIAATALGVLRSFYFGQIIFFTGASRLEMASAAALLAGSGATGLALIPWLDIEGAAIALAIGQAAALAVYVVAGRTLFPMPLPRRDAAGLISLALAGWAAPALAQHFGLPDAAVFVLAAVTLAATGLTAILSYDILELGTPVRAVLARLRLT